MGKTAFIQNSFFEKMREGINYMVIRSVTECFEVCPVILQSQEW